MKKTSLLMIPGPTPVRRRIQDALARETIAFGDPDFIKDFKGLLTDLKDLVNCSGEAFVISGSGTMGMEMGLVNSLKEGDRLLVISTGFFGDRFIEMAKGKGIIVDSIKAQWGQRVSLDEIEKKLKENSYQAITVTHVDTSTGVRMPIGQVGELLKSYEDTIYIVDGVCSTGAYVEDMEEMNIDILVTGSQKALGVQPGLAIVWASEKALRRRKDLGEIQHYFLDFSSWLATMRDPSKYFATPGVNMVWGLCEAMEIIKEEGKENRQKRHEKNGGAMAQALEALGFKILASSMDRATTLSNPIYMEGVDDLEFRSILKEEGVMVAGGLGPYQGKMFRIGHMGNVSNEELLGSIAGIERTLERLGHKDKLGKGLEVLNRLM